MIRFFSITFLFLALVCLGLSVASRFSPIETVKRLPGLAVAPDLEPLSPEDLRGPVEPLAPELEGKITAANLEMPPRDFLGRVHQAQVEEFVQSPGFGPSRMVRVEPVSRSQAPMIFVDAKGDSWVIEEKELIGLRSGEPKVYQNKKGRSRILMEDLHLYGAASFEKRALTQFEEEGVRQLEQNGDGFHARWHEDFSGLRLVSALRAKTKCLQCHEVEGDREGDLLGGLSYVLRRQLSPGPEDGPDAALFEGL